MVSFDTTATAQEDVAIAEVAPNTNQNANLLQVSNRIGPAAREHSLVNFVLPPKPRGSDRIDRLTLVLTYKQSAFTPAGRTYRTSRVSRLWTEGSATWNTYSGSGATWSAAGGDKDTDIGSLFLAGAYGSSFAWDITALNLDWNKRGSILLVDQDESGTGTSKRFFDTEGAAGTTAWKPHIVITAIDDSPKSITDIQVQPDVSLSESSYTYRQRALLTWSDSDEDDFKRYRIRVGKNRSLPANHTHLAFINSRGSTIYLDTTLYSDGTTIYYSMHPEDQRNGSTSTFLGATYTNVSNVVSWTKPNAIIGSTNFGSSASTLDNFETRVRTTTMADAKKAKIVWGDGGTSFSETLTSAGGYFFARHRYTKATAGYTIRAQIEDVNGFRSAPDSYGTSVTISNLGPVAKIVASPSRQRTASTFSFGNAFVSVAGDWSGMFLFPASSTSASLSNGVATSFRFKTGTSTSAYQIALLRPESGNWRIIYAQSVSAATVLSEVRRNVNWKIEKGDIPAINATSGAATVDQDTTRNGYFFSMSSSVSVNQIIPRWRASQNANTVKIRLSYALTNPVHFSAKDSFARGSNRVVNRFRWDTDYNGTFGSNFETGASTSFYYAWTAATTQFIAVRAVDDSHASSIDIAGVVIETESTFRIPDDIRDVVTHISDNRGRAYTMSPVVLRDYGVFDIGPLEPVIVQVHGTARTESSTVTGELIDVARISAAFQQRKRVYIVPPWSTSTAVQGYILNAPTIRRATDPTAKEWTASIGTV